MKRIIATMTIIVALALGTGLPTGYGNGGGDGPFSGLWDLIADACSGDYIFPDTLAPSATNSANLSPA